MFAKKLAVLSIFLTIFVVMSGCVSTELTKNGDTTYTNKIYGFSIDYPSSWYAEETNDEISGVQTVVTFMGPIKDDFQTNINIVAENAQGYTFNQYLYATKQNMRDYMSNYFLIKEGNLKISEKNAYFLEWSTSMYGYAMIFKQFFVINNGSVYIITCTSNLDNYANEVTEFNRIASTFKFL